MVVAGQKKDLSQRTLSLRFEGLPANVDHAVFTAGDNGKLLGDPYMTFYGQPQTPCGGVRFDGQNRYDLDLDRLPAAAQRLTLTLTLDANAPGNLSSLPAVTLFVGDEAIPFSGMDVSRERALLLVDVYRYKGGWRQGIVFQGFNGGLADLVRHFGATVADDAPTPAAAPAAVLPTAPAPQPTVSLSKQRLINLEKSTPGSHLINLAKTASISLEKKQLDNHTADVVLVLDFSASMSKVFDNGFVQQVAERVLAAGVLFDDNASVDVFLFDNRAQHLGELTPSQFQGQVARWHKQHGLGGGTKYGAVIQKVREHFFGSATGREGPMHRNKPVYVLFVTDGDATDKSHATRMMREVSYEPIFWQFVGVHTWGSSFDYLERLDHLDGRLIDNANFFEIRDVKALSDQDLYQKMFAEYPEWLKAARQKGLVG